MLTAFVERGTAILEDESLTPEQFVAITNGIASMYAAFRVTVSVSSVPVTGLSNTKSAYALAALQGTPFLIAVNGAVIHQAEWAWNAESKTLALLEGFRFSSGQTVELWALFRSNETLPTLPTS